MIADCFLDTNILLYGGSAAAEDAAKRRIAEQLISSERFAISTQVVQEYIANALGKRDLGLGPHNVRGLLDSLDDLVVLPVTVAIIRKAWGLRSRHTLSYWDAAILAAAQELGCRTLYSEDLSHGQDYDGVKVINPFL